MAKVMMKAELLEDNLKKRPNFGCLAKVMSALGRMECEKWQEIPMGT